LASSFLEKGIKRENLLILPTNNYSPISGTDIFSFLLQNCPSLSPSPIEPRKQPLDPQTSEGVTYSPTKMGLPKLKIICFSAGVVGSIFAAYLWQLWGGKISTFIAVDGWGMPLKGDFPIYTLSHDFFTYASWGQWNHNSGAFYADPPVSHLQLWHSPHTTRGQATNAHTPLTALEFIFLMSSRT
jgi:hypothetical protein